MGKNADKTFVQSKMLNISKGPAVHSLRMQSDRKKYHIEMKKTLENQENLDVYQAEIVEIIVNEEIHIGNIGFNSLKGEIKTSGQIIKLTSKESQIFEILIKNKNMVVSKEQLMERIWGFQTDIELNNIEVYLSYLRKKLAISDCGIAIETIRARGYCLREVL
jgi:DNA-binding response OmpR family regulator